MMPLFTRKVTLLWAYTIGKQYGHRRCVCGGWGVGVGGITAVSNLLGIKTAVSLIYNNAQIQAYRKSEMHRLTPELPWTLNWGFFGLTIGYNGEIQNFVENWKLKISKIRNSTTFLRTTKKKIREKFERIQKWFEGGVAVWLP